MRAAPMIALILATNIATFALPAAISGNNGASATNVVITAPSEDARQAAPATGKRLAHSTARAQSAPARSATRSRHTPLPLPMACASNTATTTPPQAEQTPVKLAQANSAYLITQNADGKVIDVTPNPEASTPLHAEKSPAAKTAPAQGGFAWQLINTLLKLALVLMLAYFALLMLKKYQQGGARSPLRGLAKLGGAQRAIHVLETASIGQGRTLHLLMVGGHVLLVGAAGQQISLLGDMTDDAEVQAMMHGAPLATPAMSQGFANLISRFLAPQNDAAVSTNTQAYASFPQQGGRQ